MGFQNVQFETPKKGFYTIKWPKTWFFLPFFTFSYFFDFLLKISTKMTHILREIKIKDVSFRFSWFLFDLSCDFDKNESFFQEIKGGTLYQNSRFSHNLNKNEEFKGRIRFVEKLKSNEISFKLWKRWFFGFFFMSMNIFQ